MKRFVIAMTLTTGMLTGATALAEETACVVERLGIRDCFQNVGMDSTQFKTVCMSVNQHVPAGGPTATIEFKSSCPTPAQGVCQNFFGKPIHAFYYGREAELLSHTQAGCEKQGGTWKSE